MLALCSPIAVVVHDAGAANIIFSWMNKTSHTFQVYAEGPAASLWRNYFPEAYLRNSLSDALDGAVTLVSGTGWASSLEHNARLSAKQMGIYSIAVIDHWVNYQPRFVRNGVVCLPDEIWVTDDFAYKIALETFRDSTVTLIENYYLINQLLSISPPPEGNVVLYFLEPIRGLWGGAMPGEFQALEYALNNISSYSPAGLERFLLRPHPSEDKNKYNIFLEKYDFIKIDISANIAEAISQSNIVVGVESFALTVALAAGRPTFSSIPPSAPAIRLPHTGIIQIRNLVKSNTPALIRHF